jgi:hypothetical protein
MERLYVKEIIIIIISIIISDLDLVWVNEHLPHILCMPFHSLCDAEGLIGSVFLEYLCIADVHNR